MAGSMPDQSVEAKLHGTLFEKRFDSLAELRSDSFRDLSSTLVPCDPVLRHRQSSVHAEVLAGNERRGVAGQEHDGAAEVLRHAPAIGWDQCAVTVLLRLRVLLVPLHGNPTGR